MVVLAEIAFVVLLVCFGLLVYLSYRVDQISRQPLRTVEQPDRCASCGRVIPFLEDPVEFNNVPVTAMALTPDSRELLVHFKVCHPCVNRAAGVPLP
jgi:hypothetical protein